jgi:hypothetical protein
MAITGRTTRNPDYAVSQRIRKRSEEAFGSRKGARHRGLPQGHRQYTLAMLHRSSPGVGLPPLRSPFQARGV